MEKIVFSEEEMNRAVSVNGKYYTIITRPTDSGKTKISAVWVKTGGLVADWATKTVNYMYEVNPTIISLNAEILKKRDTIKTRENIFFRNKMKKRF